MTPLDMIHEWRKGCSCASEKPEECEVCTRGLITALELWLRKPLWERVWLRSRGNAWLQRFREWRALTHYTEPANFTRLTEVQELLYGTTSPLTSYCTPSEVDSHAFRNYLDLFVRQCDDCCTWRNPDELVGGLCKTCR